MVFFSASCASISKLKNLRKSLTLDVSIFLALTDLELEIIIIIIILGVVKMDYIEKILPITKVKKELLDIIKELDFEHVLKVAVDANRLERTPIIEKQRERVGGVVEIVNKE